MQKNYKVVSASQISILGLLSSTSTKENSLTSVNGRIEQLELLQGN